MMKTIAFILTFIASTAVFSCEVELPQHLLFLEGSADVAKDHHHSGCSFEALSEVNVTLAAVQGGISSHQLSEILRGKGYEIRVLPKLIQIQHLRHLIRDQLALPEGIQLKSSASMDAPAYIVLDSSDRVNIECSDCLFGIRQPINIQIRSSDGTQKSLSVLADFRKMVKAFRVIGSHAAFSEVTSQQLREEYVEAIPHTDLFTALDTLKFFRLNKPIRAGQLLKLSDLNPQSLVRAGVATEVVIENELLKLKTTGISRSNGVLGQMVEVYHPLKKKKYLGKVIDLNKVLVNL